MKNVLVIGSRNSGKKNDPVAIDHALRAIGTQTSLVYWEDLIFHVRTGEVSITAGSEPLLQASPDLVVTVGWYKSGKESIYRDAAYSLALFLKHSGVEFWNSEMLSQRSSTKLSCMVQLALAGISVPETSFSLRGEQVMRQHFPFIAKAAGASRGEANFLIKNQADLDQLADHPSYYLVQPYLENDHDLRIICFNSTPSLALRRFRAADADTHLNNTSQGGNAEWMELSRLPKELLTECEKICKIMKREMAGIDFIPNRLAPSGYSCLEVNAIPQLTSGFDVEKKLTMLAEAIARRSPRL